VGFRYRGRASSSNWHRNRQATVRSGRRWLITGAGCFYLAGPAGCTVRLVWRHSRCVLKLVHVISIRSNICLTRTRDEQAVGLYQYAGKYSAVCPAPCLGVNPIRYLCADGFWFNKMFRTGMYNKV